jgi:hypothetical protein
VEGWGGFEVGFVGWGIFVRHVVDVEYDGLQAQENQPSNHK